MSVFVEIDSMEVKSRSGISAKTNKPYTMREQFAYLHHGKRYPTEFKLTLEDNQHPYPIGKYELDDSSFFVGKFDDLQIKPVLRVVSSHSSSNNSIPSSGGSLSAAAAAAASGIK